MQTVRLTVFGLARAKADDDDEGQSERVARWCGRTDRKGGGGEEGRVDWAMKCLSARVAKLRCGLSAPAARRCLIMRYDYDYERALQ